MADKDNWLMEQALISAQRLVTTPDQLLRPAGRTLKEVAAAFLITPAKLSVVPAPTQPAKKSRAKKRTPAPASSAQLPFLAAVQSTEGSTPPSDGRPHWPKP